MALACAQDSPTSGQAKAKGRPARLWALPLVDPSVPPESGFLTPRPSVYSRAEWGAFTGLFHRAGEMGLLGHLFQLRWFIAGLETRGCTQDIHRFISSYWHPYRSFHRAVCCWASFFCCFTLFLPGGSYGPEAELGSRPHAPPRCSAFPLSSLQIATRKAYGQALAKLGHASDRIIALDGDTKNSTFSELFKKEHPDQFIECYIAEQNMVGAAGV